MAGEDSRPASSPWSLPDGAARQVADDVAFPNGMAVTPDDSTLIVAESYANRLTAFDIERRRRPVEPAVWADLGDGVPDGICLDAEGAVWYADVPNQRCVRVREGGEVLQTVDLDRGCFACMLGGPDGRTLFMLAAEWHGPAGMFDGPPTGVVVTARRRRRTPDVRSAGQPAKRSPARYLRPVSTRIVTTRRPGPELRGEPPRGEDVGPGRLPREEPLAPRHLPCAANALRR